jgi:hypothetical protein
MLLIQKEQLNRNNAGCANPLVRSIGLKLRLTILFITLTFASGCSSFSILLSGGSFAVSQNSYAKIYNAADMLTIMGTKKGIKRHAYDSAKKAWTEVKEGKEYIYDTTINLFGNKH